MAALPKDHTVFVEGFRLGTKKLYMRSLVRLFVRQRESKIGRIKEKILSALGVGDRGSELDGIFDSVEPTHDSSDYHPALTVLALEMERTNEQCVVVHDSEWCTNPANYAVAREYAGFLFNPEPKPELIFPQDKISIESWSLMLQLPLVYESLLQEFFIKTLSLYDSQGLMERGFIIAEIRRHDRHDECHFLRLERGASSSMASYTSVVEVKSRSSSDGDLIYTTTFLDKDHILSLLDLVIASTIIRKFGHSHILGQAHRSLDILMAILESQVDPEYRTTQEKTVGEGKAGL